MKEQRWLEVLPGGVVGLLALGGLWIVGFHASVASAAYEVGFVWNRSDDWSIAGNTLGSSTGNPETDQNGNPAWSHEFVSGGDGLGGSTPWYAQSGTLLVWHDNWAGTGIGVWARDHDSNSLTDAVQPPIAQTFLTHVYWNGDDNLFNFAPLVRWTNPTGSSTVIDITGNLVLNWWENNPGFQAITDGEEQAAEVVIALRDVSEGTTNLLSQTTTDGTPNGSNLSATISIDLRNQSIGVGDQLLFSLRAQNADSLDRWIDLNDSGLNLTIVPVVIPEPSTWALVLLGAVGLAVARRRMRA